MSEFLHEQAPHQDECAAAQGPAPSAPPEQQPGPAAVGRAQRSEPERSDGERSGARPTAAGTPLSAPIPTTARSAGTNVPYEDEPGPTATPQDPVLERFAEQVEEDVANAQPPWGGGRRAGRTRGRRLVKKDLPPAAPLTAAQRLLLLDTWQRSGL